MTTEELSIWGYCCTGRLESARHPTSTITRLTTMARTGCLMKMSVNERIPGSLSIAFRFWNSAGLGGIGRRRRALDPDRLAELEGAARRHLIAGLEAAENQD